MKGAVSRRLTEDCILPQAKCMKYSLSLFTLYVLLRKTQSPEAGGFGGLKVFKQYDPQGCFYFISWLLSRDCLISHSFWDRST